MEYVFTGFKQVEAIRHYGFEGIGADRSRTKYNVQADVALLRKYAIALQDVPLLCRRFLQEREGNDDLVSVMMSEDSMRKHADARTALIEDAARKRKQHRTPLSSKIGQAWRGERIEAPKPV